MYTLRSLKYSDILYKYVHILIGFIALLYPLISSILYYVLEAEFVEHLGIGQRDLLTYFSLFSLVLLVFSRYNEWSFPLIIEDALIILFAWVLLGNLLYTSESVCFCCGGDSTGGSVACFWQDNHILFSFLCVGLLILSFLIDIRNYYLSIITKTFAILLLLFLPIMPVSCSQFRFIELDISILKIALFITIWFIYRYMRLIEVVITNEYLKSIAILESYATYKTIYKKQENQQQQQQQQQKQVFDIPVNLFHELDQINNIINNSRLSRKIENNKKNNNNNNKSNGNGTTVFYTQLENMKEVYNLHNTHKTQRYVSWKNRYYNNNLLFILDLTSTIWILVICPAFLPFVILQLFILLYNIKQAKLELQSLVKIVKYMDTLYETYRV